MITSKQTPFTTKTNTIQPPKIAIICDWLTNMGGAERVVMALHEAFPSAPIYTSVFDPQACTPFAALDIRTTWLQKFPKFIRNKHQLFPVFRPYAFRSLNLREYDIVISATTAEAKAIRVRPGAVHICYCQTPIRYYWSHYDQYKREPGFGPLNPLIRLLIPPFVHWMRRLDLKAVTGVHYFIANSSVVASRVKQFYKRDASVVFPPVDMARFRHLAIHGPRQGYILLGRQVPYKRMDIAIQACSTLGLPLTVYGRGPDHERLKKLAGQNVRFITHGSDEDIALALSRAKGYIFPQYEDFGITQIEAMAAGCPVIAFDQGGSLDAVIAGKTGCFFSAQTPEVLAESLVRFEAMQFEPAVLQAHAEQFSNERFIQAINQFVANHSHSSD